MAFELFADSNNLTDVMLMLSDFKIVPDNDEEAFFDERPSSRVSSIDSGVWSENAFSMDDVKESNSKTEGNEDGILPSWMNSALEKEIETRKTNVLLQIFEKTHDQKDQTSDFFDIQPVYYFPPPVTYIAPQPDFYQPLPACPPQSSEDISYPLCIYCFGKCIHS